MVFLRAEVEKLAKQLHQDYIRCGLSEITVRDGYTWDELADPTQEAWRDLAKRVMKRFAERANA